VGFMNRRRKMKRYKPLDHLIGKPISEWIDAFIEIADKNGIVEVDGSVYVRYEEELEMKDE
jgi:hypothetical protein